MPRAFSSGALSIWSYAVNVALPVSARTLVIAAVSDVLPWSTWPIVPMLQCGLLRLNFSLAIGLSVNRCSGGQLTRSVEDEEDQANFAWTSWATLLGTCS